MKRKLLTLFVSILFLTAIQTSEASECGKFPDKGFEGPDMSAFTGQYSNPNYLYGVTIPKGLVGHSSPPSYPQHGFGIVLSWDPRAYIFFDSSANSLEYKTLDEAIKDHIKYTEEKASKILSTNISTGALGKVTAKQLTVHYTCKEDPTERIDIAILSLRSNNSLIDSAELTTTTDRLRGDLKIFEEMTKTWHTTGKY
ncbi:MAG TPA: hypothetical protein VL197_04000 [Nitrospirota bacterium]|nr:hypothetical protein [Nitrospirota bacterium]